MHLFCQTWARQILCCCDAPLLVHLSAMRSAAKSGALFIYVSNGTQEPAPELLPLLDDVWLGPCSAGLHDFRVARLLDAVQQHKDHELSTLYLDEVINITSDLVWFKDAKGAHVKVNEAFCRLVGKTRQQVEGRGIIIFGIWSRKNTPRASLSALGMTR